VRRFLMRYKWIGSVVLVLGLMPLWLPAQTYTPIPFIKSQWFTSSGAPAAGYKLCTYAAGTTTPATTYSTSGGSSNTNPVTLDTAGRASIFLAASSYKFILYAPGTGNTCNGQDVGAAVWTVDSITGVAPTRAVQAFGTTSSPTCSMGGINSFIGPGSGVVSTTSTSVPLYISPIASSVSSLGVIIHGAGVPGSESAAFTIQKNGVDTALTCTIGPSGTVCSDSTHSLTLATGDTLGLKLNCSGGGSALTGAISTSVLISQ
jgi:hypothetical protein